MAIFRCVGCGLEKKVSDIHVDKRVKCPKCSHVVRVFPDSDTTQNELSMDDVNDAVSVTEGEKSDILCPACGTVHSGNGNHERCRKCDRPFSSAVVDEPTEDDVALDDLAEVNPPPRIWEGTTMEEEGASVGEGASVDTDPATQHSMLLTGGIFQNVYAGCVTGLTGFFFAVVYGVFASSQVDLPGFMPYLVSTALLATAVVGFVVASRSRIPFAAGGPDAILAALLFLFLGSIYRSMDGVQPVDVIFPTLAAAVAVAGFVTGVGLWLMSLFKAGRWMRYIPTQVLGGVYGAMGAMVLLGAWSVISVGTNPESNQFVFVNSLMRFVAQGSCDSHWIPSAAFALVLFGFLYRARNTLVLLALLMVGVGIGHAADFLNIPHVGTMLGAGLLPSLGGLDHLVAMLDPQVIERIDWQAISRQNLYLGAMVVLTLLRMMARSTRIEAECDIRADLDNEYGVVGGGGMLAGLVGGMPASISYGRTLGNFALGARGRLSGAVAAVVAAALFFYSGQAMSMVPRFVVEGLLIYVGIGLIKSWLFDTATAFTRRDDRRLAIFVFVSSLVFGMLVGVGVGVASAMMLTVSRNSRNAAVKNELSGAYYRSNVDRAPAQLRILKEYGDHIHILRLQGFVFLGTIYDLIDRIRARMDSSEHLPMEYIVIDFSFVSGFASATDLGFAMLRDFGLEHEVNIIFTNAPLELADHLERSGYVLNDVEGSFKLFMNLDYALEWCETQILDGENHADMHQLSLHELLAPVFPEPRYIPLFMKMLTKVHANKGEVVIEQGDYSDTMYFVESGTLNVVIESEDHKPERIKKVGPGAVFGEMGFYTNAPRSATVQAAEQCVLYLLDRKKLALLEKKAPVLATAFNRYLVNVLSERLVTANKKAQELR